MKIRSTMILIAALAAVHTLSRAALAADSYTIDPRHMSIVFSVGHAGLSYTYGMFREAEGAYILDKANSAGNRFQLTIKANSLYTNDAERDTHLRGPTMFNVEQFPSIRFESTSCERQQTPEGLVVYNVVGNLTMHGETRQIKVPLQMLAEGPGAMGDKRTGFLCQMQLKRSDFGMNKLLDKNMVGDAVSITISFEGYIPNSAPARAQ